MTKRRSRHRFPWSRFSPSALVTEHRLLWLLVHCKELDELREVVTGHRVVLDLVERPCPTPWGRSWDGTLFVVDSRYGAYDAVEKWERDKSLPRSPRAVVEGAKNLRHRANLIGALASRWPCELIWASHTAQAREPKREALATEIDEAFLTALPEALLISLRPR